MCLCISNKFTIQCHFEFNRNSRKQGHASLCREKGPISFCTILITYDTHHLVPTLSMKIILPAPHLFLSVLLDLLCELPEKLPEESGQQGPSQVQTLVCIVISVVLTAAAKRYQHQPGREAAAAGAGVKGDRK